jgi:hypothetical protein
VEARRDGLVAAWQQARAAEDGATVVAPLGHELEWIARSLLGRLA